MSEFIDSVEGPDPVTPLPAEGAEAPAEVPSESPGGDGTSSQKVVIENYKSNETTFANVLNRFQYGSEESLEFSSDMVSPLSAAARSELLELVAADDEWVEKMLTHLHAERVLLLTGRRHSGKGTVAKYLAARLAERLALRNETQIVDSLQTRIRILMRKVAGETLIAGHRVAVFLNVLFSRNSDLMTFFTADRSAWEQLAETLRTNDTYWIFTASESELQSVRGNLTDYLIRHEMPPTPSTAVEAAVDRKLTRLEREKPACVARIRDLRMNREQLVREIRSLPHAMSFIDEFLRGESTFEAALDLVERKSATFISELLNDGDAWCAAFTLALCHAVPGEPVAWTDFDRFRRLITERVKSDLEIFPPRRMRPDELPPPTAAASLADDLLLERGRMRVTRDPAQLKDMISFDHDSEPDEIWDEVLNRHRRVLLRIVPVVRSVAESEAWPIRMRIRAAQILGRIGVIDAPAVSLPLIEQEWLDAGDVVLHPLIGRVVEGVLVSGCETHQHACLGALEVLTSHDTAEQPDETTRNRLGAAIAAYSQLGAYAPARAMDHLGAIACQFCAPSVREAHDLFIRAERAQRARSNTRSKGRAERLRRSQYGLNQEALRKLDQEAPLLFALERAIVYLCFENDPIRTLAATRDWIEKGGTPTATLMTFLFLRNGGIADRLDDLPVMFETELGPAAINRVIVSAAQSRDAIRSLCAFLADLHAAINGTFTLPVLLQRDFRERFEACLTNWAGGAAAVSTFRDTVEEIFVVLARVRDGAMRRDLYTLIGTPAFAESELLSAFAASVRKRIDG